MAVDVFDPALDTLPKVEVVARCASTNDEVKELAHRGAPHGSAIAAHEQTKGRGRRGHVWCSPAGGLYLSILLRPAVPMRYFVGLPAVCALGVVEALDAMGATGIGLKWPNDIVINSCKLAGLLVEGGSSKTGVYAVAGVGINVHRTAQLAQDLNHAHLNHARAHDEGSNIPALDVAYLESALSSGVPLPSFEVLAQALRNGIVARCNAWVADVGAGAAPAGTALAGAALAGPVAPVLSDYCDRIELLGESVVALHPNGRLFACGRLSGIDAWGKAILVTSEGAELELIAEQASIRPAGLYAAYSTHPEIQ